MQSQQSLMLIKNQGFFPANLSYTNGLGVRVNLSGQLESHLRGLDLNTPNCPGTLLIGAVS